MTTGKIIEKQATVFEWHCPSDGCGRILRSMFKKQIVAYAKAHMLSHELDAVGDLNGINEVMGRLKK